MDQGSRARFLSPDRRFVVLAGRRECRFRGGEDLAILVVLLVRRFDLGPDVALRLRVRGAQAFEPELLTSNRFLAPATVVQWDRRFEREPRAIEDVGPEGLRSVRAQRPSDSGVDPTQPDGKPLGLDAEAVGNQIRSTLDAIGERLVQRVRNGGRFGFADLGKRTPIWASAGSGSSAGHPIAALRVAAEFVTRLRACKTVARALRTSASA